MAAAAEIKQVAKTIAGALQEPQVRSVQLMVTHLGVERAQRLLQETLAIEARGGLLLADGSRRRTPGGVFFQLVRQALPPEEVRQLFPDWAAKKAARKAARQARPAAGTAPVEEGGSTRVPRAAQRPAPPALHPLAWAERAPLVAQLLADKATFGKVDTVKITLIGRPGKVIAQGATIMTTMQGGDKVPALPKGVPTPPGAKLTYLVYIAEKQWKKVAEAVKDPEDVLIVEGYLTFDAELGKLTVLTQNVTTKALQRAKKQPAPEKLS